MRIFDRWKSYVLTVVIILSALSVSTTVTADAFETAVYINPSNQTVFLEDTFTIGVYCAPGQPIKSFEFKLSFNASLLQVNSVTGGDIFDGYAPFFNFGTIDNNAGSIVEVYGLILGSGNISNNGTLVNISFTAKSTIGTSSLNLCGVGVTNDTEYVSIVVNNGSAIVRSADNNPILSSPDPTNGLANVPISTASLSINIQDPDGDTFNYTISTSPNIGSSSGNESSNGSKSCSISGLDYSTTYTWYVSCMDTGSGNLTNKSYWFTTESNGGGGDGDGDGGGLPPPGSDTNDTSGQNNPPETPVKPSGPTYVEMSVEYIFMSSTYDVDGDEIRYRFDWGDGNYSNWSDFMSSNTSVSMSHYWSLISNYSIRVMAQDENGSNSSWSPALSVTVSQAESGEIPPVADVNVPSNASADQIIVFNASGSYDIDGVIASYQWDFGDGTTGSGVSPEHVYENPGEYTVTLVITDNNGNTYSKTMTVDIASETKEEQSEGQQEVLLLHFGIIFVGLIVFIIGVLAVFFIDNVKSFFSGYGIHQFLHRAISRNEYEVGEIESNIEKTKISANVYQGTVISQSKLANETDFKRSSVERMSNYYDEIQKNHIENDYGNKLDSEESTFSDNSYEFHTGEKIEEILREELKSDKSPIEDSEVSRARDIESIVDALILSNTKKKLSVENNNIFDVSTDIIRRKIDNL
jgi:PKD repeat protein